MKSEFKKDYQKELDELLDGLKFRPRLLLHSCCGPCSSYVCEYLVEYFDLDIFYFNPNIYPEAEYNRRVDTQKQLLDATGWGKLIVGSYDHKAFLTSVQGMEAEKEGGERCRICFTYRLAETAHLAATGGYDYFGTTLTVSPHKNAEWINQIGSKLADQYGVPFLPSDFKKKEGFKKSTQLSKEYNLYRQNYCGCEFSIWEGATVPSEMEKEKKG